MEEKSTQKSKNKSNRAPSQKPIRTVNGKDPSASFLKALRNHVAKVGLSNTKLNALVTRPSMRSGFIPIMQAHFAKGTQNPVLSIPIALFDVAVVNLTAYNTVFSVLTTALANWTELSTVFDQFRPLGGVLTFTRNVLGGLPSGGQNDMIAVIDYEDITPLASMAEADEYDTKKTFFPVSNTGDGPVAYHWPLKFDWLPTEEWQPMSSTAPLMASWKPFLNANHTYTTAFIGRITGHVTIQFRGMK
jgi:hypothetical protein